MLYLHGRSGNPMFSTPRTSPLPIVRSRLPAAPQPAFSKPTEACQTLGHGGRPRQPTVLVTDADRGSALAIIRSLGRRGWRVIAGEAHSAALGFASRYTTQKLIYPSPERDTGEFVEAILQTARSANVDLIIPVTDAAILPLSAASGFFQGLSRLAIPDAAMLETVIDKTKTLDLARRLQVPVPQSYVPRTAEEAASRASELGWPVVLKPYASWRLCQQRLVKAPAVAYAETPDEVREAMRRIETYGPVLLQEYVRGEGQGIEMLAHEGQPLAVFQHRRLREVPLSGGRSSLRESVAVDPVLFGHAARLLKALNWTGLAMVEFKTGPDRVQLMEINGRVWGSLPLAAACGVDFPAMWADLMLYGPPGGSSPIETSYPLGVRVRNLDLELVWIASVLARRPRYRFLEFPPRRRAIAALLGLLNPACRFDVANFGDLKPALVEFFKIGCHFYRKCVRI